MTKIIAVVNQKGGVAKTTTTNALGIGLANKGYTVLLVDMDPQGNLSMSLGIPFPDKEENGIAQLLLLGLQGRKSEICITDYIHSKYGVDFLVGNDDLGKIDRMLSGFRDGEYMLQVLLQHISEGYDCVIIDCMPSVGNLTESAIIAADEIIVPSEPQYFSTKGIQSLFDEISVIQRRKNPKLKIAGILPTKVDTRTNITKEFMSAINSIFGNSIYLFSPIPSSVKLAECNDGKNIYEYDPNGKGVKAYLSFVDEYLKKGSGDNV